ncbi:YkvA family protein [Singulisphaera sp. PoT]|uniref:YkvA family protein n=1 Tax=Singulisphaera sp. PoT TaxID=3411797 RepID=UPI003BF607C9
MTTRLARWFHKSRQDESKDQGKQVRPEDYVGADEQANERMVREGFVLKAKRHLNKIPLAQETVAMYFALLDPKTPLWVKGTVAAALAYFILPFDAIPDILPIVGMSDDAGVLAGALTAVSAHITSEHRERARAWMQAELGPKAAHA